MKSEKTGRVTLMALTMKSAFAPRNRPVCRWGAPRGALQGPWGRDPGGAARPRGGAGDGVLGGDPGRPRTRGKGPSDTALVPPPDHPSTSRHPRPRPRGLQAPPIRARGSVWPANPGPPFSAPSNHSPPFQSGSGPASSARSAAARPLRAAPSPRSPQAVLGPRKGGVPAQPRGGTAPLPHVPLRRCRCRRLCFRSRACAAAAPDGPCWDQGGRVAQLRAHVPSGSSSGRRGGGGSGPFNGAAVEQSLLAQPRRGAAPLSTSPPAFPSGAGLGAFASGSGGAAPALPRCPQALLKGRVGGPRSCPVPEFSREKGREAGSGRKRSSPWERGVRGQRDSWDGQGGSGQAGIGRAGRCRTLGLAGLARGGGAVRAAGYKWRGGGPLGAVRRRGWGRRWSGGSRPGIGAAAGPRSGAPGCRDTQQQI
ncbi:uncharacterized protein LOC113940326 [Corapipo altera]|uniref:uncharacterized protein LOC113940326 n=1 Tax=Corapipo altera TaxID=415028 RepID=UPI000FD6575F|nr:uncharacterized protein LOC113940326 [Corapipo altera]